MGQQGLFRRRSHCCSLASASGPPFSVLHIACRCHHVTEDRQYPLLLGCCESERRQKFNASTVLLLRCSSTLQETRPYSAPPPCTSTLLHASPLLFGSDNFSRQNSPLHASDDRLRLACLWDKQSRRLGRKIGIA